MSLPFIISERSPWQIQDLTVDGSTVICHAVSTARGAACPCCSQWSTQVQSRYTRWVRDVPWRQAPVRLAIQVRRFVCRTPTCPRRIFAERLPQLPPYARRTAAFTTWVAGMGWAHSAETAAALATTAGYPVSPDTVLRLLRRTPDPTRSTPRVLGVDDWALRKGRQYGTVLVDLETHQVVEVLPDRRADTIAAWLATHPGVAIVTRDRSETYAQGIARGAPAAQQVADRWHLLHNLAEAVDSWLAGWRPPPDDSSVEPVGPGSDLPAVAPAPDAEVSAAVQRRRALWEVIHQHHTHGATVSAIARELGVHRATVRAYLAQPTPPGPPPPRVRSRLAAWIPQLDTWYAAGARTGKALWETARAAGFPGSRSTLYAWLARAHPASRPRSVPRPAAPPIPALWLRQACFQPWIRIPRPWDGRLSHWLTHDAALRRGWTLVRQFVTLVRHRRGHALAAWVRAAETSGPPALAHFAQRLRQDWEAVRAAVTEPWSQGPVEAAVTGIKRLRRLMQGRGNWDLLRRRVLYGLRGEGPVPGTS